MQWRNFRRVGDDSVGRCHDILVEGNSEFVRIVHDQDVLGVVLEMLRRIGLLFALLGAVALGMAGYVPAQADTFSVSAPMMMHHGGAGEMSAEMGAQHACCPEGSMGHGPADTGLRHISSGCDDFSGCADGPCGLTTAVSAMLQDTPWSPIRHERSLHSRTLVQAPADISPTRPEHPPRA